jgi:protein-S-isoprenylcysteine O-methyltransferase
MAPRDATVPPSSSSSPSSSRPSSSSDAAEEEQNAPTVRLADLAPDGTISLTSISLEAYILGILLGAGISWASYFIFARTAATRFWRAPAFLALLSLLHFCEFYAYARWNLKHVKADSFLTRSNGRAYAYAMALGLAETVVTGLFFPRWQDVWARPWIQAVGAVLVVAGQVLRHAAIVTAGNSFHHLIQRTRSTDHVLVTTGPYAVLRHPSYFGFYWWAVGTQILLGNALSTPLFAAILWQFFFRRTIGECEIGSVTSALCSRKLHVASHHVGSVVLPCNQVVEGNDVGPLISILCFFRDEKQATNKKRLKLGEERALIKMFGDDYVQYRSRTTIGIPFMGAAVDAALKRIDRLERRGELVPHHHHHHHHQQQQQQQPTVPTVFPDRT